MKTGFFFTLFVSVAIFIFWSPALRAQDSSKKPAGYRIAKAASKMMVEFDADTKIYNVLVIVSDSLGATLFMDNQYRFEGHYKTEVDLKKPGTYSIDITCDEKRFSQKIKFP